MSHPWVMMTRLMMTVMRITSKTQRRGCQGGSHLEQIKPLLLLLPLGQLQPQKDQQQPLLPAPRLLSTQQQLRRPLPLLLRSATWRPLQWGTWMQTSRHCLTRSLLHCCRSCCLLVLLLTWPWQQ
jgi:hypothetical protein